MTDKGCQADFELGYDYHTCDICRLCQDEVCPELAEYLCRLDFVMADLMAMNPVIFLFPGTCCHWRANLGEVIPLLEGSFYVVCVSYDGFDETEARYSPI